jgi:hypothetical protein
VPTIYTGPRAPDGAPIHYERHRPEQTTLYRLVQQHATSFIAHTEANTGAELPRFIKDEFDAFLECGIVAHGFLRLRCGECGHPANEVQLIVRTASMLTNYTGVVVAGHIGTVAGRFSPTINPALPGIGCAVQAAK